MKVTIDTKHFIGSSYIDIYDCALARTLKQLGYEEVYVGGTSVYTSDAAYIMSMEDAYLVKDNYLLEEPKTITVELTKF